MNNDVFKISAFDLMTISYYVNQYLKKHPYCKDEIIKYFEMNAVELLIEINEKYPILSNFVNFKIPYSKNKYKYVKSFIGIDIINMKERQKVEICEKVVNYSFNAFCDYFGVDKEDPKVKKLIK